MKGALKVANVLSWFSLIFFGINVVTGLLLALASVNGLTLVFVVIAASIPLQSYAALQLHKSIRRPEVKLSHQTPAGIRFVGLIALFLGFIFVLVGSFMVGKATDLLDMIQKNELLKQVYSGVNEPIIRRLGAEA